MTLTWGSMATTQAAVQPVADVRDFVHTGPGTLAGRYLRLFAVMENGCEELSSSPTWVQHVR